MNTNIYIKSIKTDDAGYITDIELSENTIDFTKLKINGSTTTGGTVTLYPWIYYNGERNIVVWTKSETPEVGDYALMGTYSATTSSITTTYPIEEVGDDYIVANASTYTRETHIDNIEI